MAPLAAAMGERIITTFIPSPLFSMALRSESDPPASHISLLVSSPPPRWSDGLVDRRALRWSHSRAAARRKPSALVARPPRRPQARRIHHAPHADPSLPARCTVAACFLNAFAFFHCSPGEGIGSERRPVGFRVRTDARTSNQFYHQQHSQQPTAPSRGRPPLRRPLTQGPDTPLDAAAATAAATTQAARRRAR